MIRQFIPRWPGDRHARPNYMPSSPPTRTQASTKVLSRYCSHRITIPVSTSSHLNEMMDWIDMNESACGLYYVEIPGRTDAPYHDPVYKAELYFECSTTAMLVKLRWG